MKVIKLKITFFDKIWFFVMMFLVIVVIYDIIGWFYVILSNRVLINIVYVLYIVVRGFCRWLEVIVLM